MRRCLEFTVTKPYHPTSKGLLVLLHVTPGASSTRVDRLSPDGQGRIRLRCRVTDVPENGKANKAAIKLLAKKLRLPQSAFQIIAGRQSREKDVLISGDMELLEQQILTLLAEL